jgi:hypothetical protein
MLRNFLSIIALSTLPAMAQVQERIEYRWLNQPCAEMLNCNTGCSACNIPSSSSGMFFGTNAAFIGVEVCPLPLALGDNGVFALGWELQPSDNRALVLSGIAVAPMRIDSIRFRHYSAGNGPDRLKVMYTSNVTMAPSELLDIEVPTELSEYTTVDLGCVTLPDGNPMGAFQLKFMPYGSTVGAWVIDEVIIVGSSCDASSVGVVEMVQYRNAAQGPWVDLLGRPMGSQPGPGVYIAQGKRIRVVE